MDNYFKNIDTLNKYADGNTITLNCNCRGCNRRMDSNWGEYCYDCSDELEALNGND